jgi:hypothetical protein
VYMCVSTFGKHRRKREKRREEEEEEQQGCGSTDLVERQADSEAQDYNMLRTGQQTDREARQR